MIADAPVRPATPTERKIAEMLVENTGAAMMDSGGIYGRAWQTTRARYGLDGGLPNSTFHGGPGHRPAEPELDDIERIARVMRDEGDGFITDFGDVEVRTFPWLTMRVDYLPEVDAKWQLFQRVTNWGKGRYDKDWGIELVERFVEQLDKRAFTKVSFGIYPGEGGTSNWVNTYNGECALDRTLQFLLFHVEITGDDGHYDNDTWVEGRDPFLPEGSYVMLQVHGGADVRGGYTDPVLFSVNGEQADLFDFDRAEVWCEGAEVLPDGVCNGQVTIEAEIIGPSHTSHRWDNSYGDGKLNLTYANGDWFDSYPQDNRQALVLPYREDDLEDLREQGLRDRYGYTMSDGTVVHDTFITANVATRDDNGDWRCPFDGSPLHASGAIVG